MASHKPKTRLKRLAEFIGWQSSEVALLDWLKENDSEHLKAIPDDNIRRDMIRYYIDMEVLPKGERGSLDNNLMAGRDMLYFIYVTDRNYKLEQKRKERNKKNARRRNRS